VLPLPFISHQRCHSSLTPQICRNIRTAFRIFCLFWCSYMFPIFIDQLGVVSRGNRRVSYVILILLLMICVWCAWCFPEALFGLLSLTDLIEYFTCNILACLAEDKRMEIAAARGEKRLRHNYLHTTLMIQVIMVYLRAHAH
jgi:hypothetical protein